MSSEKDCLCSKHGDLIERQHNAELRLTEGESRFNRIEEIMDNFKNDMKAISNEFGNQARELKNFVADLKDEHGKQLRDIKDYFGVVVNGDAKEKIKGYEERIGTMENDIRKLYKIMIISGTIAFSIIGFFAKVYWNKMTEVMVAIEHVQKLLKP